MGAFEVSDDGNLLAYTTDTTGFRQFRLSVKDLRHRSLVSRYRRTRHLSRMVLR